MDDSFARYRPYLAMMLLFIIVLAGTIFLLRRPEQPVIAITTATPRATATPVSIVVEVRGAIAKPGVYTLPAGSRVQDVIALAGDLTTNAETRALNLARKVNDGEQLYIPAIGEATPTTVPVASKATPGASKAPTGKININTATIAELDTLPGIGPAIAQRIIEYRAQNGAFQKIEDLKKVRGIGDVLFDQIKDLVTVE
jgi:competence protein ComEA